MKFESWLPVYGDTEYRGDCPKESMEQVTFFGRLRREYPDTYGALGVHPKNEEKRSGKDFHRLAVDKAMGLTPGASDIVIPGAPSFVCEMKRKDHTKSAWQDGQQKYLKAAQEAGCFVCVALGADAAWQAFQEYIRN